MLALLVFSLGGSQAEAGSGLYDFKSAFSQPHPFADHDMKMPWPQAQAQPQLQPVAVPAHRQGVMPTAQAMPVGAGPALPPPGEPEFAPSAASESGKDGHWNYISEFRLGAFAHDQGTFSHNKESGVDGNLEVLFVSPDFMDAVWSPRPHLGLSVNSGGDTSQAYFGITWEWDFWDDYFFDFGWGGSVHNGKTVTYDEDRKELGCHLLFREAIDLGYRFTEHHSLMFHADHISNGKLCSQNEGLESFGVRYGYKF